MMERGKLLRSSGLSRACQVLFAVVTLAAGARPARVVAQNDRIPRINALVDSANAALNTRTPAGYRRSIAFRLDALPLIRKAKDRRFEGLLLLTVGGTWLQLGEPDSAISYTRAAMEASLKARDTVSTLHGFNTLAQAYWQRGEHDSTLALYRQGYLMAERGAKPPLQSVLGANLGNLFYNLGQNDSAAAWSHRILALSRREHLRTAEIFALMNLVLVRDRQGFADSALGYARQGVAAAEAEGSDSLALLTWQKLAEASANAGQRDSSLVYLHKALAAARRSRPLGGESGVLRQIALVFLSFSQTDSALRYLRLASAGAEGLRDPGSRAQLEYNWAQLFEATGESDSAVSHAREASRLYALAGDTRGTLQAELELAELRFAAQDDSLLAYATIARERARGLGDRGLELRALTDLAGAARRLRRFEVAERRYGEALSLARLSRRKAWEFDALHGLAMVAYRTDSLRRAVAYFDSADATVAWLRQSAGGDFQRAAVGEGYAGMYDLWARALFGLWLQHDSTALVGALNVVERGRARALLDLMSPIAAVRMEATAPKPVSELKVSYPGLAILAYYLSEGNRVYSWTAFRGPVLFHTDPPDTLTALVAKLRVLLGVDAGAGRIGGGALQRDRGTVATKPSGRQGDWRSLAAALSRILFPSDVRQKLNGAREILIIPHGVLAEVPFALLPWGSNGDLVGDHFAIRYAPSIAIAEATEQRPVPEGERPLIVGNPRMPTVRGANGESLVLAPLPSAAGEASALAALFGRAPLTGTAASETAVREGLRIATLVHMATHGYAYSSAGRARESFVALAPDDRNDGVLTVGEILDDPAVTLQADLVVLSACQTGLGDPSRAEGTIGLQRAFLAKGARSVLVSLWNVSDEATSLLMGRFYSHWRTDPDRPFKSEALRRAQDDLRQQPRFAHPRFWAAFQLVGAR